MAIRGGRPVRTRTGRRTIRGNSWKNTKLVVNRRAGDGFNIPYLSINPKNQLVKMRFSINSGTGRALTSTAGSIAAWVYRAGDCYDPYQGAGGGQPRNFDQYMAMYRHGIVLKSKITLEFFYSESAAVKYPMKVGVLLSDSSTTPANVNDLAEFPRVRSVIMAPGSGRSKKVTFTYTPNSFFSVKDCQDNTDLYFSTGSSPEENALYHIFGHAYDGNTEEAYCTGHIDYTVLFLHPLLPSAS